MKAQSASTSAAHSEDSLPFFGGMRLSIHGLALGWLVAGLAIEAILVLRLAAQVGVVTVDTGLLSSLFNFSEKLIGPFNGFEPSPPIRETGIIQVATLVALEAYFIALLAPLTLYALRHRIAAIGRGIWRTFAWLYRLGRPQEPEEQPIPLPAPTEEPVFVLPERIRY